MEAETTDSTQRIVLDDISWQTYESLLADLGDRPIRIAYNQGKMEIMAPSRMRERLKKSAGRMVEALTEELNIPIGSAGSTTYKSQLKARGLEPDECYYIENESTMRGRDQFDPAIDPPPDLALEMDVTSGSEDRMEIHAALGVPEVWRFHDGAFHVYQLGTDGRHHLATQSRSFPFLPMEELNRFMACRNDMDETTWIRKFRQWIRENLSGFRKNDEG